MNVEDVRRIIVERFAPRDSHEAVKVSGPCYSTNQSEIFIAWCPGVENALAVKHYFDRDEFNQVTSLGHVWQEMAEDGEFSVPHTVAFVEEEAIAITEWVDAPSFGDALRKSNLTVAKAHSFANRAGQWLKRYHKTVPLPPGDLDVDRLVTILEEELALIGPARRRDVEFAVAHLLNEAEFIASCSISQGQLHGDFKPENILVSDARTVGIDFQPMYQGAVIRDLASFINHLLLIPYEPTALKWFVSRDALAAEFLRGYTDDDTVLPIECLAWLRLHRLTRVWGRQQHRTNKVRSWYLSRCVIHEMRRLCTSEIQGKKLPLGRPSR